MGCGSVQPIRCSIRISKGPFQLRSLVICGQLCCAMTRKGRFLSRIEQWGSARMPVRTSFPLSRARQLVRRDDEILTAYPRPIETGDMKHPQYCTRTRPESARKMPMLRQLPLSTSAPAPYSHCAPMKWVTLTCRPRP
jgi:hypothetical protein